MKKLFNSIYAEAVNEVSTAKNSFFLNIFPINRLVSLIIKISAMH
jgi:hypothetical protein